MLTPDAEGSQRSRKADVILSLDWVDLAGTLKAAKAPAEGAKVIHVSIDYQVHNGWSMDHQGLAPVDVMLAADPEHGRRRCSVDAIGDTPSAPRRHAAGARRSRSFPTARSPSSTSRARCARPSATSPSRSPISRSPGTAHGGRSAIRSTSSARDGGGGLGAGPGVTVGAALALKGTGRIPIGICGDGDFLMGATAIWTAAHYRIPLLIVVANNRSFYNDEVHQERVARMRNRPVENKWIGQRISDPDIDLAALARAQGALGFGPIEDVSQLAVHLREGHRRRRARPGRRRRCARRARLHAGDDGRRVERREEEP